MQLPTTTRCCPLALVLCGLLWLLPGVSAGADVAAAAYQSVVIRMAPGRRPPPDSVHCRLDDVNREQGMARGWVDAAGLVALKQAGYTVEIQPASPPAGSRASPYATYAAISAQVSSLAATYPTLCSLSSIGRSMENRDLWLLRITNTAGGVGSLPKPQVKITGGIHGNEFVGTDVCLRLAHHLLENYGTTTGVLVDTTDICILPLLNPDGYVRNQRENVGGKDLNRDFPIFSDASQSSTVGRQPETALMMNWVAGQSFALGLTYHSGALGVAYPWGHDHQYWNPAVQNPETALYLALSLAYASTNAPMYAKSDWNTPGGDGWVHGTINGAQWYPVLGEMQDWSYRARGTLEITVELSENDYQPPDPAAVWADNLESLLSTLRRAHGGARGLVRGHMGGPLYARVGIGRRPDDGSGLPLRAGSVLQLAHGWNLVSLPLTPDDPQPEHLFPGKLGPCWRWENGGYQTVDSCRAGQGFWVYEPDAEPAPLTVVGELAPEGTTPLAAGWNLVGPTAAGVFQTTSHIRFAFGAGGESSSYSAVAPGAVLVPAQAYWVWTDAATTADWREGANRPCASYTAADRGAFSRCLAPGVYELWADDPTPAAIAHTPPASVTAGTAATLDVTLTLPRLPVQWFGVRVPTGFDGTTGLPAHATQALELADPAGDTVTVTWSGDGGFTWTSAAMSLATDETTASLAIPTATWQTSLRYYFEVRRGARKLAFMGTAAAPLYLALRPPTRNAPSLSVERVTPKRAREWQRQRTFTRESVLKPHVRK